MTSEQTLLDELENEYARAQETEAQRKAILQAELAEVAARKEAELAEARAKIFQSTKAVLDDLIITDKEKWPEILFALGIAIIKDELTLQVPIPKQAATVLKTLVDLLPKKESSKEVAPVQLVPPGQTEDPESCYPVGMGDISAPVDINIS